jgi:hypothetical protein
MLKFIICFLLGEIACYRNKGGTGMVDWLRLLPHPPLQEIVRSFVRFSRVRYAFPGGQPLIMLLSYYHSSGQEGDEVDMVVFS